MSQLNALVAVRATVIAVFGVLTKLVKFTPTKFTVDVQSSDLDSGILSGVADGKAFCVNLKSPFKALKDHDIGEAMEKIRVGFDTIQGINEKNGKGKIESLSFVVAETDLDAGTIKGSVHRSCGDERTFTLKTKESGRVQVRFLDKKQTVN